MTLYCTKRYVEDAEFLASNRLSAVVRNTLLTFILGEFRAAEHITTRKRYEFRIASDTMS